jgi:hypothetical protein
MLFADKIEKDKGDMCLDSMCWQQKQIAATKRIIEKNKVKYPNLVIVGERCNVEEAVIKQLGNIKNKYDYMPAKKEDKKAVPCLDISNGKAGSVNWMKPRYADSADTKTRGRKPATMESRKDELNRKRWFFVLGTLEKLLDETPLEKITPKNKTIALLVLVAEFEATTAGINPKHRMLWTTAIQDDRYIANKKATNTSSAKEYDELLKQLWEMVKLGICQNFRYMGPITQTPDEKIEAGKKVAWLIGADIDELTKKACEEYPVPKAWGKRDAVETTDEK